MIWSDTVQVKLSQALETLFKKELITNRLALTEEGERVAQSLRDKIHENIDEWMPFTSAVYQEKEELERLERRKRIDDFNREWEERWKAST